MESCTWSVLQNQQHNYFFISNQGRINIEQKFYHEIFNSWSEVRAVSMHSEIDNIMGQILWNNRYLQIQKKTFHWEHWACKGIMMLQDIITENGTFMNESELRKLYNIRCSFLDVLQIRECIPKEWKDAIRSQRCRQKKFNFSNDVFICDKMYNIETFKTSIIYNYLIKQKYRTPTCITKWKEIYPGFNDASEDLWPNIFKLSFKITRETKLQSFQFKIIHRLITCQKKLHEMKIVDSDICLYCAEKDDLKHFFLYCNKSHSFWNSFFKWWNNLGDIVIAPDYATLAESILFGFQSEGEIFNVINYCILLAKYYIYCQKIHNNNKIDFYQYLAHLRCKLSIEENIMYSEYKWAL